MTPIGASLTSVTVKRDGGRVGLRIGDAVGRAVVLDRVVEVAGPLKSAVGVNIDVGADDRHRAADRVAHRGDGQRLAGLVGRTRRCRCRSALRS